jgi:hypothetical protein
MFLGRCNGYSHNSARNLSKEARESLVKVLPEAREKFKAVQRILLDRGTQTYLGSRFESDDAVLARVGNVASSDEVLSNPMGWALDALRDCAAADHWYEFEKSW